MSCKKAIFMAIDGVSRELLEEANAGVYVEPENAKDFAEKVLYYISNPELAKAQGEAGYEFAIANFDRAVLATKYLGALKSIQK